MKKYFNRAIRFLEIDCQYLSTNLPLSVKIYNVFITNVIILRNILFRSTNFSIQLKKEKIFYDTIFATKTFLAATYDFYIETKKLSILPREPVVVDIGANIGQYLFAVKSFFPKAKIYSFEPDPNIVQVLKKNVVQYSRTHIYEVALGNQKGNFDFYRSKHFSEWSSLIKPSDDRYEKITVPVKKGDNIDSLSKLEEIDLLKIDVEGAELKVVEGMLKTIRKSKYLLIETSLARDMQHNATNKLLILLFSEGFTLDHIGRIFSDGIGKTQGAADLLFFNRRLYEKNTTS